MISISYTIKADKRKLEFSGTDLELLEMLRKIQQGIKWDPSIGNLIPTLQIDSVIKLIEQSETRRSYDDL